MNLSSGDPQPIISNVALGPSALGQHWKLLASAHHLIKPHCKLATLSPGKKPMLPSRRYFSLSPASRQRLQFYNEFIKWWPSANNFQCCPRAFGPRATLEIIGFGSPLDKASLYRSKPPSSKATLVDIPWGPERLFRPLLPGRQHWFTKTKSTTILWRAMSPGRQHCYSQRRQVVVRRAVQL